MSNWHEFTIHPQIIPTVLIPLTALSVVLSTIAVFIAGLFGIKLKADGPKKLLEVLLKPKVLISACLFNLILWGGYKGFVWVMNAASLDFVVAFRQGQIAKPSNRMYPDVLEPVEQYTFSQATRKSNTGRHLDSSWSIKLPKGSFSEPAVSGNSLFVGSDDGFIYEIDKDNGQVLRSFYVGTPVTPRVLIYKGFLYSGEGAHDTHHARVSKYNLSTGQYVGSYRTTGHIEGQLSIDEQAGKQTLLLVSGGSGGLYAIDPDTMGLLWNVNVGHNDAGARVGENVVYFGTGREKNSSQSYRSWAAAVNRTTGDIIWKRELPASSWMQPVFHKDNVCYVFGEIYFKSEIGGIACFDKLSGQKVSMYYHFNPIASKPIIVDNDFIVTDFEGRTCRIDSDSMKATWCQSKISESYSLAGLRFDLKSGSLVKSTRKAEVVLLDPYSGEEILRWQLTPGKAGDAFAPVAIGDDGWFYVDLEGNLTRLVWRTEGDLSVKR